VSGLHNWDSSFRREILIAVTWVVCRGPNCLWVCWRQDTLREDCDESADCVRNCCVNHIIAPVFFVVFVLMAQFVLVNVVVAVLMKHLEVRTTPHRTRVRLGSYVRSTRSRLKITTRSFRHATPQLSNKLLHSLRAPYVPHCSSLSSYSNCSPVVNLSHGVFHSRLKTYLYSKSFPP